ncbi:thyrotropin-releasing hormone receptor-like [Acanthaster planci]|uniref:Thyrotropin-releasing hormone receptor-like n=1 Tax=Acanthaster planci TaxID=133434 RepID=A0A8B7Y761_ACAPL|nr:thyrotropin-releasing hormone receptor-like [Acanthaster planci]
MLLAPRIGVDVPDPFYLLCRDTVLKKMASSTSVSTLPANSTLETPMSTEGEGWFHPDTILLPVIRCCIGTVGIIGNLLVCIVVVRLWGSNKRNTTNTLIANQAMIDFVASVFLVAVTLTEMFKVPPPQNYFFGQIFCKFWASRMLLFGIFASSTINLTAISIERYLAVIHPIYYSMKFASTIVAKLLPVVPWVIGPFWQFVVSLLRYEFLPDKIDCIYEAPGYTSAMEKVFGLILFLWEYFIPTIIMTFAFVKIALKFRQQNLKVASRRPRLATGATTVATISVMKDHQNSISVVEQNSPMENSMVSAYGGEGAGTSSQPGRSQGPKPPMNIQRKNVTKTLFVVFIFFVICWSPDQWAFLQYNLGGQLDFGGWFVNTAIVAAQLNSCVNPLIYGLQYRAYRQGLKKLFCKCKCRRG